MAWKTKKNGVNIFQGRNNRCANFRCKGQGHQMSKRSQVQRVSSFP